MPLDGFKTYIAAVVMFIDGSMSLPDLYKAVEIAILGATVRHGVSTSLKG